MLDDFRQDKQDQPLDPLSEDSPLPLGKKVGLLCLAVALIGLFIFFTSDTWSSDSKKPSKNDELAQEIDQIKIRLSDLEQRTPRPVVAVEMSTGMDSSDQELPDSEATPMANLKSLIEQELQETSAPSQNVPEKTSAPVAPQQAKKQPVAPAAKQTYTVKKGDTLSKIAQQFYGSPKKWRRIVDANKDKLGQSQVLKVGMVLAIPKDS